MDKEYLEDYAKKEEEEHERLVLRRIREGRFDFEKIRYPPDERFVNLQDPVAYTATGASKINPWAQIPFCGSLIWLIPPFNIPHFEKYYFEISKIPQTVDFIKETGRLQVVLTAQAHLYEGLDYLDPFFEELSPPIIYGAPLSIFGNEKEIRKFADSFYTLARVRYADWLKKGYQNDGYGLPTFLGALQEESSTYIVLKLGRYRIVEDIENLMIDDPEKAWWLIGFCRYFIKEPLINLRTNLRNFPLELTKGAAQTLPLVYQPREIRFPQEIGKFLLRKLTYAAQDMRACYELMDHYDAYDLQKIQKSLNEAIVANDPDIIRRDAEGLSEILDNAWNDKTIPRRIKAIRIGMPLSMAVIGSVAAGPIGATGGFLAGLGFSVADKLIDVETEGLSEKLARLKTKSYQANVYDFKKKYKDRIVKPRHK